MSSSESGSESDSSSKRSGSGSSNGDDYEDEYDESKNGSRSASSASSGSSKGSGGSDKSDSGKKYTESDVSTSRRKSSVLVASEGSDKSGASSASGSRRGSGSGSSGSNRSGEGRWRSGKSGTGTYLSSRRKDDSSDHESSDDGGSSSASSDTPPKKRPEVKKHVVPHARSAGDDSNAGSDSKPTTRPSAETGQTRGAAYAMADQQVTSVSTKEELNDLLLLNDQLRLKLEAQRSILQKGRNTTLCRSQNRTMWKQYQRPAAASFQRMLSREGTRRELLRERDELLERQCFLQRKVYCIKQMHVYVKLIQECKNDIAELSKERRALLLSIRSNEKLLVNTSETGDPKKVFKQLADEIRANSVLARRILDHRRRDAVSAIRMRKDTQKRVERLEEQVREAKEWEPPTDLDEGTRTLFEEYRWKAETICELHKKLSRLKAKSRGDMSDSSGGRVGSQHDKESRAYYVAKIRELRDEIYRLTSKADRQKTANSPTREPVDKSFTTSRGDVAWNLEQRGGDPSPRIGSNEGNQRSSNTDNGGGKPGAKVYDPLGEVKRRVDEARRSNTTSQLLSDETPQSAARNNSQPRKRGSVDDVAPGGVKATGESAGGNGGDSAKSKSSKQTDGQGSDEYASQRDDYDEDAPKSYSASRKNADDYSETSGTALPGEAGEKSSSEIVASTGGGTDTHRDSGSSGNNGAAPNDNEKVAGESEDPPAKEDEGASWLDF
ncbi:hypothetical protein, conserved [Trypanosoma brucei gambiense DAL972]|uniref:Uncharacterized protein n=1 Tax=Trypanosoma brucei gambiense (strain MHOM/CI/86/DAL972) TaxID=679716 RepID=D0AA78_TRYB9|nr:hypothetical protein, conserved [Trypanosoma brucei gambiense DAL972]CBH18579.1 hypothetical protein, conserved [Trypanosoma brucei gambiense DAL972]|eukprot:XP_011780843.1 hypothetical protein, conserved [Trypanosoma brucei gambiense DAL972]